MGEWEVDCWLCRLVFCNYKDPVGDSEQICPPKGVGVQCEGILNLGYLTFLQLPFF